MNSSQQQVMKKVSWRILPLLLLLYIVAYVDRVNISFAALEMNKSLGFNASIYGFAAGIFFIGYFIFEVPSNILLAKFGARIWITRILITWGIIVILLGFIHSAVHLYILRFLLGLAEAGLFPGILFYLTRWYPRNQMAKVVAIFMSAIPVAFIVGGPISTWLMDNISSSGLEGWRWMFIIEGAAAVLLGPITLWTLTDSPQQAKWLTAKEKTILLEHLAAHDSVDTHTSPLRSVFGDWKVWYLSVLYFFYISGTLGLIFFIPQLVKQLSLSMNNFQIGLITAIPYIAAGLAMNYWARRSDRLKERYFHAALPLLMIIVIYQCMNMGIFTSTLSLTVGLIIAVIGIFCFNGPFWAIPTKYMQGTGAAAGIAIINSCGGLGGFSGPYIMGYFKDTTGSNNIGLTVLSVMLLITIVMLLGLRKIIPQAEK